MRNVYRGPKNPLTGKPIYAGMYPGGEMGWASGMVINRTRHQARAPMRSGAMRCSTTRNGSSGASTSPAISNRPTRTWDDHRRHRCQSRTVPPAGSQTDLLPWRGRPADSGTERRQLFRKRGRGAKGAGSDARFLSDVPGAGSLSLRGGPGPIAFGTSGDRRGQSDADHDSSGSPAMGESGHGAGEIIATKYTESDPAKGIASQRPLCPHPQVPMYEGSGDLNDASNFSCVAPK